MKLKPTGYFLWLALTSDAEMKIFIKSPWKWLRFSLFFILILCWPATGWLAVRLNEPSDVELNKPTNGNTMATQWHRSPLKVKLWVWLGNIIMQEGWCRKTVGNILKSFSLFPPPADWIPGLFPAHFRAASCKVCDGGFRHSMHLKKKKQNTSHCSHRPAVWFPSVAES